MKFKTKLPPLSECIGIVLAVLIVLCLSYMYVMIPYGFVMLLAGK